MNLSPLAVAGAAVFIGTSAQAKIVTTRIPYELSGTAFEGVLLFDDASKAKRPGLVLIPNWMGVNEPNVAQAAQVAGQGYVVFVADMYGKAGQPKTQDDAGKLSSQVKGDRALMRARVAKALEVLRGRTAASPLDSARIGAIGFCFGGTSALELARSGAKIAGVVSFHGGLSSPAPADAKSITAKVLVLHGADDPFVPPEEVKAFEEEMRAAKVDWQLIAYGNAVHSFTDPDAKMAGKAEYHPLVAKRAYQQMQTFFTEAFAGR